MCGANRFPYVALRRNDALLCGEYVSARRPCLRLSVMYVVFAIQSVLFVVVPRKKIEKKSNGCIFCERCARRSLLLCDAVSIRCCTLNSLSVRFERATCVHVLCVKFVAS